VLTLFWLVFWLGLTALAFAAGVSLRVRLKEKVGTGTPMLADDDIQRIIETGRLTTSSDEPLDLGDIDEEEKKFWSESWDEPEEW